MSTRYLQAKAWLDRRRQMLFRLTVVALSFAAVGLAMQPASAAGRIKPNCGFAHALGPVTNWFASNVLGLASLGSPLLIILLVLALILVFTKWGVKLLRYAGMVIGLILLIGIVQNVWGIIPGTVNC